MTWNHRVTRELLEDGSELFAIREVHYDTDGAVVGWTRDPIAAVGDTAEDVAWALQKMLEGAGRPVLDLADLELEPAQEHGDSDG